MVTEKSIDEVRKLAKQYKVKIRFFHDENSFSGYWDYSDNSIYMNTASYLGKERTREIFLGTFFHELGHTICFEKGLYKNYHGNMQNKKLVRKIALKAERFVDKIGGKEFEKHYPELKYPNLYYNKESVKMFRKYWLDKHYKI